MGLKEFTVKSVGKVIGSMPFTPRDRKIPIPGTGYSIIKHTPEWGKKHKKLYTTSRFAATGLMLFGPPVVADSVANSVLLYQAGQHRLQINVQPPAYDKNPAEQAAKTGELKVAVYNINLGRDDTSSYVNGLEDHFNEALWGLGIDIKVVKYMDINPQDSWQEQLSETFTAEQMASPEFPERFKNYATNFEQFIRNTSITDRPSESHIKRGNKDIFEIAPELQNYLYSLIGSENVYLTPNTQSNIPSFVADIGLIVADFKDGGGRGVAYNHGELTSGTSFALMDKRTGDGNPLSDESFRSTATHELVHKLGIGHSSFNPLDVMSYAPLSRWVIKKIPQLAVGPETWFEWRSIKKQYTESDNRPRDKQEPENGTQAFNSELDDQLFTDKEGLLVPATEDFTPASQDGISRTGLLVPNHGLERTLQVAPELDTPVYRQEYLKQFTQS